MNKVILGDATKIKFKDNNFDTVIVDPPYGLKFMGKSWDGQVPSSDIWKEVLRVSKPGAFMFAFGGTRTFHRLTCAIEDAGWEIRDCMMWLYGSGFPKSHDISKGIDKAAGVEREQSGVEPRRPNPRAMAPLGEGARKCSANERYDIPATDLAHQWDGWGTALKPAWEPIIVAMKPLDGTFAQNAEKWGVAGLWIDGGRIGTGELLVRPAIKRHENNVLGSGLGLGTQKNPSGRWPANLILDEEAAHALDEMSGPLKSGIAVQRNGGGQRIGGNGIYSGANGLTRNDSGFDDSGGASRFFYCAKASRKERNAGLDGMPEKVKPLMGEFKDNPGRTTPKSSPTPRANHHPTVKPVNLLRYLVKLSKTPEGGIVLDPFAGSGSTGIACALEGRNFIGIEINQEYVDIANKRIEHIIEENKKDNV